MLLILGFCMILPLLCDCNVKVYNDGVEAELDCSPSESGIMNFMFRIEDNKAKYLFTVKQSEEKRFDKYDVTTDQKGNIKMKIKSFNKSADSGIYICAALNYNKLNFGVSTELKGVTDPTTQPPKIIPVTTPVVETTTKCQCPKKQSPKFSCETWILSSLACGCGFLLLLLICTILYCNRLRTRRCPHHYKRQAHPGPARHTKLPNTHF
ncbi:hypothetical protein DNTS_003845 [Danionella cerebrum]|uniref:Immunoglobulin V-set domain-containing protein n=1 Tax=Danionella cerebrum TaxID=2873325 RepID=A0A553QYU5_9TELE|nr:hypothetical protein DNTS_003845 [Danionella translucida]